MVENKYSKDTSQREKKKLKRNITISIVSLILLYLIFFHGSSSKNHDSPETNTKADFKIVRLDDVSHGGASRLSVLVQTNPDFWEYHLIYIIDRINDYYKNEFDIIWITIIPDVIRPNSLDDSLKIINGSDYWLTIAQSLYVSPYKEKWNPGFNFIVHDESNGALISWERHSYYYEP